MGFCSSENNSIWRGITMGRATHRRTLKYGTNSRGGNLWREGVKPQMEMIIDSRFEIMLCIIFSQHQGSKTFLSVLPREMSREIFRIFVCMKLKIYCCWFRNRSLQCKVYGLLPPELLQDQPDQPDRHLLSCSSEISDRPREKGQNCQFRAVSRDRSGTR